MGSSCEQTKIVANKIGNHVLVIFTLPHAKQGLHDHCNELLDFIVERYRLYKGSLVNARVFPEGSIAYDGNARLPRLWFRQLVESLQEFEQ